MAEASWPFFGAETNETQFSKWARSLGDSGIISGLALTPGTGLQVSVATGVAFVRGLYYENNTSAKTLTVGAAPSTAGQTRRDAVILKLNQGTNLITCEIKAGTANSSGGALPSLQQDENVYELLIGEVRVAQGTAAITGAMITEFRPALGNRILVNTEARKPAAAQASGQIFFNLTSKQIEYSDGSTWSGVITVDTLTGILPVAKGGTAVTTYKALREALDIYVQPTAPAHKAGRVHIPGTALV